jgi:tetratricopeptide (TPR) repeat protein
MRSNLFYAVPLIVVFWSISCYGMNSRITLQRSLIDYSKPQTSTERIKGEKVEYELWLNKTKWKNLDHENRNYKLLKRLMNNNNIYVSHVLNHISNAILCMIQEDETPVSLQDHHYDTLKSIRKGGGHIIDTEIRTVNGNDLLYIKYEATAKSTKWIYLKYSLSNKTGTTAIIAGTTEDLFPEHEADMFNLLNGLVAPNYEVKLTTSEKTYYMGIEYATQGKYREAKEEFEKALKVDPSFLLAQDCLRITEDVIGRKIMTDTAAHLFKGVEYGHRAMIDEEIWEYKKAIEANPMYAEGYYHLGNSYYYQKAEFDQAISNYNKAIEINSRFANAYVTRANIYYEKEKYDQAMQDYNKAIEMNPRHGEAHCNRGMLYKSLGKYDRAIQDYNKAIQINPRFANAYNNRGFVYFVKLGDRKKGCSDWKRACELGKCNNYNFAKRNGDCK